MNQLEERESIFRVRLTYSFVVAFQPLEIISVQYNPLILMELQKLN